MSPIKFPSEPTFILHCNATITTINIVEIDGEKLIAVGTQLGEVYFYNYDDFHLESFVYGDDNKSAILNIIHVGDILLVHVRGHHAVLLQRNNDKWKEINSHSVTYPGFCRIVYLDGKLLIPLSEQNRNSILIARLDSHSINTENSQTVPLASENASPMCAEIDFDIHSFLVGDDSGMLSILATTGETKQINLCKEPIFALASSADFIAAGSSVNIPIMLLKKNNLSATPLQIPYIQKAGGINSLCFSPSGSTLFGSFWDGMIRGYSAKKLKLALALSFQDDNSNIITWLGNKRFAAGSKEGRLSIWEL